MFNFCDFLYHSIASSNFPGNSKANSKYKVDCFQMCSRICVLFLICLSFQERSTHLTELVQKSGSDSSSLQRPKLRPKPRPPEICAGPGTHRVASCHHSRTRLLTGIESPIYNSSLHLTPGQQIQTSPSFQLGPHIETSLPPSRSSSEPLRYCPTHRGALSSFNTSWKNL